jgi:hypothetical protein
MLSFFKKRGPLEVACSKILRDVKPALPHDIKSLAQNILMLTLYASLQKVKAESAAFKKLKSCDRSSPNHEAMIFEAVVFIYCTIKTTISQHDPSLEKHIDSYAQKWLLDIISTNYAAWGSEIYHSREDEYLGGKDQLNTFVNYLVDAGNSETVMDYYKPSLSIATFTQKSTALMSIPIYLKGITTSSENLFAAYEQMA